MKTRMAYKTTQSLFLFALLLPVSLFAVEPVELPNQGTSASFYLRAVGNSVVTTPAPASDPFSPRLTNSSGGSGTGFELEQCWTSKLVSHLRIDYSLLSGDDNSISRQSDLYSDTTYHYNRTENVTLSKTNLQLSLDLLYEPFGRLSYGKVRTRFAAGPYIAIASTDRESNGEYRSVNQSGSSTIRESESTSSSTDWQLGLRAQFTAEWWFNEKVAFICRTGMVTGWYTSEYDSRYSSQTRYIPAVGPFEVNGNESDDEGTSDGWQLGLEGVIAGFRFHF